MSKYCSKCQSYLIEKPLFRFNYWACPVCDAPKTEDPQPEPQPVPPPLPGFKGLRDMLLRAAKSKP